MPLAHNTACSTGQSGGAQYGQGAVGSPARPMGWEVDPVEDPEDAVEDAGGKMYARRPVF